MVKDFWDDSALIKAFDSAISNYKIKHEVTDSAITPTLPIDQSNQCIQNVPGRIDDNDDTSQVLGNAASSAEDVDSSDGPNGSVPSNDEIAAGESGQAEKNVVSSDVNCEKEEYTWNPNDQEAYNQLWSRYYEVEEERQKIMQQLNQYGDWNYETYATDTQPTEEHKGSVHQPYETVTCHCPYGCQNLVLPCTTVPGSCLGGECTDKDCKVVCEGVCGGTSSGKEDPDFVKTAMDAAERALSSLMKQDCSRVDLSANGGKNNELGVERDHVTDSANSATDLSMVLKAWYSAGFYTGKYLSEQSSEKKTHC